MPIDHLDNHLILQDVQPMMLGALGRDHSGLDRGILIEESLAPHLLDHAARRIRQHLGASEDALRRDAETASTLLVREGVRHGCGGDQHLRLPGVELLDNTGERRAQLVRGVGDEALLGPIGASRCSRASR